jgi:hypothetical protein
MKKEINIELDEYNYNCSDNCCTSYGTVTTLNGVELQNHNQDAASILEQVLIHLGYKVTIKETYNGN